MLKAIREAKQHTSWVSPDADYEAALAACIEGLLRPSGPNPFIDDLQQFVEQVAPFGFHNSLSQLALKLTVPGVPDLYQGCEQWNFSLVDPDNRRPVDFGRMAAGLHAIQPMFAGTYPTPAQWREVTGSLHDGRLKQMVTWRLLQLRQSRPQLMQLGGYLPLAVSGAAAPHAIAFGRAREGDAMLVVASRMTCTLCDGDTSRWQAGLWQGTQLLIDAQQPALHKVGGWRDWISGRRVGIARTEAGVAIELGDVFASDGHPPLPFAVLVADDDGAAP